jgi:hypothetical protein
MSNKNRKTVSKLLIIVFVVIIVEYLLICTLHKGRSEQILEIIFLASNIVVSS